MDLDLIVARLYELEKKFDAVLLYLDLEIEKRKKPPWCVEEYEWWTKKRSKK